MSRLFALVMGNAAYPESPLRNPANDAEDIGAKLIQHGFQVTALVDADYKTMRKALKAFEVEAKDAELALVYFAGHGVQIDGKNYLIALDTEAETEADVEHGALSLNEIIDRLEQTHSSTNLIILDACRDNPWDRKWRGGPRGLAPVYAPKGTLIAYATSPGQIASDGTGRNGAYTEALLKHIDTPDVPVEAMFKRVRNSLSTATNGKQISWEHTSLSGEFYFNLGIANRIDEYSASALEDRLLILDEQRLTHRTISALKSYNWYTQNPALVGIDLVKLSKGSTDNLFVLGRNILQAANGSATAAKEFIRDFPQRTRGMPDTKRKALLDGMLFEIFFNKSGELREAIKGRCFDDVFALQAHAELSSSFAFISAVLAPYRARYFVLPGKDIDVTVDIQLSADNQLVGIYINGRNHMAIDQDFADGTPYEERIDRFEEGLPELMVVPTRNLTVVYTPTRPDKLKVPYGFEILRPDRLLPATSQPVGV